MGLPAVPVMPALPPVDAPPLALPPPVALLPPVALVPPLVFAPPLLLPPPPASLSNRLFLLGLPQAAAPIKTKPAHQTRTPPVNPCRIAGESNIEKALCSRRMREHQFDGLVGPTHHYAGLSSGNLASQAHAGEPSNPRAAALEGLAKMRRVRELGVAQAVLPPQPRPSLTLLRRLGFAGTDAAVLEHALRDAPELLHAASSASSMWAANAATVVPACDARDAKTHLVPANLVSLLHRSLEATSTEQVLRRIFADPEHFVVHAPLPASDFLADEGAANHTRLFTDAAAAHVFGWGRRHGEPSPARKFPARQTHGASAAVARCSELPDESVLLWQQDPRGIDAGAFHTDVLAVGNANVLLLHERAFLYPDALLARLRARLGGDFLAVVATESELPLSDAVGAYPFNSQLLSLPGGKLQLVAPLESQQNERARSFLERAVAECALLDGIDYLDVNGSMKNGGGPACLRLRVPLDDAASVRLSGSVMFDTRLESALTKIVEQRYRDQLALADMADPELVVEARTALDEITQALGLGSVYDFQS
jgi:succinylarginine dihydrolase